MHFTDARPHLRRVVLAVLAACLVGTLLGASVTHAAPSAASARGAGGSAAYDGSVGKPECNLLGRKFTRGLGCSRTKCTDGAVLWRKTFGAEACALKGAQQGYGFVSTVDSRQCRALNRRWIARVNYCASEPDRSIGVRYDAPQCFGAASVYVPLSEAEGYFDECLTVQRALELTRLAGESQTTLADQVALRSSLQCPHRPGRVFVDGVCASDPGAVPSGGGVVVIGDSLTWRGSDELAQRRPSFTLDGEPARRPTELEARLDFFRSLHGEPDGLIVELGTVPAEGFGRSDLRKVLGSLPARTQVMLVLPYFEIVSRPEPVVVSPASQRMAGWMRQLATSRHGSCTADWPSFVKSHPGVLQDGVHTKHAAEGRWARWIAKEWTRC